MRKNVTEDRLEPAHFTVIGYLLAIEPVVIPAYRINSVNEDTYLARNCLTYIRLESSPHLASQMKKLADGGEKLHFVNMQ